MGKGYQMGKSNWRSFKEARAFVHQLQLKNKQEWESWVKSGARPNDIPAFPNGVYKDKGWDGVGDWLGTGVIANQNRNYRSFEEARAFVQQLHLRNQKEWRDWAKNEMRPANIPANPALIYKDDGWIGFGDWLGTGVIANQNRNYRSFEEARAFVHQLQLKNKQEWERWVKSGARPDDIPAFPNGVYKDRGWDGVGDWLGTGVIANQNRNYRSFEEARAFVQQLHLRNQKEWRDWAKSEMRPDDIPAIPESLYKNKGWSGWGDWLGTGVIANQNRNYRSFEEARAFVQQLQLRNQKEWRDWAKKEEKPYDIPASPAKKYANEGWSSWGDWLGTGTIAPFNRIYRSFEEARRFSRSLRLRNHNEWQMWSKTQSKPDDIPADPANVYRDSRWLGWGDWLGIINLWRPNAILSFLYSLHPVLFSLESSELYAIMRQNGMIDSICSNTKNVEILKSIKDLCSTNDLESECKKLITQLEDAGNNGSLESNEDEFDDFSAENDLNADVEIETDLVPSGIEKSDTELPQLKSFDSLKAVDLLVEAGITSDHETIEFLICNRVSALWQSCLNNDPTFDLDRLRNETVGTYFQTIRDRFLSQHDGAANLSIPNGYNFPYPPNLMQRLTAYRILKERMIGNWSGVGAGKTPDELLPRPPDAA